MGRGTGRLLFFLVAVALPPVVAFAVAEVMLAQAIDRIGTGTALLIAAGVTVAWAGILAIGGARVLSGEARALVELVERGRAPTSADDAGAGQQRLAAALDERNRQIAELAERSRDAEFSHDAGRVVRTMVEAVRSVTRDPTWTMAIMQSADEASLARGAYGTDAEAVEITEVHRWASTLESNDDVVAGVRHATGPWGAFVVVDVARSPDLRAALVAPWEGRDPPSAAERDLLSLLGKQSGMTIEHAVLYARLSRQTDEVNRLASVQSDFLRGISHDLQTPLTSIRALAGEIATVPSLDATAREDLATIAHQADRLRRMVGQLLAVSRLEAGVLVPRSEPFRPEDVVRRAWRALRADRPFDLTLEGESHLAVADPDRFEQVVWAILDNAVKYSRPADAIDARITGQGSELTVEITDAGLGMDAETLDRAFEQFYRAEDARHMVPDGSGIGLYAAAGLMQAMGGSMAAASRKNAGTTITLRLPSEPAVAEPDPPPVPMTH